MDNIQQTLERQVQATDYFRTRGDAAVSLLDKIIEDLEKNLNNYRSVREMILQLDKDAGIEKPQINAQLVSVLRGRFPEKTKDLTDEQVADMLARQDFT